MLEKLVTQLDLSEYLQSFEKLFARQKSFVLQGDSSLHFKRINELCELEFKPSPSLKNLDTALTHLSKQGVLHLEEIFEFVKIISYFIYLKKLDFKPNLASWLDKIIIPSTLEVLLESFTQKGELKTDLDERLINLENALKLNKESVQSEFKKLIYSKSLSPYLIDTQIHFISQSEALLVRGGFNHTIKAKIVARSSSGGFYILPLSVENLQNDMQKLYNEKEMIYYEYAKNYSLLLHKNLAFLKFINSAFDLFDHYSARVLFAKARDYEFILASSGSEIVLKDFAHPALKNPKSVSLDFSKQVLLITGVNAGGKSMLLKSLLAAAFLTKYLLPMKINANLSKIGSFKHIQAILEDPQNVKNDISTFAGRMLAFSKLLGQKELLLGVDEIELGTDFEEAASLYSVLIQKLMSQNQKIIITTHHKRLAMLLAKNEQVELIAALYDEKASRPKYEFLKGTIGKSYAFETALRYGISENLVSKAKHIYGEDKGELEELINKNINLELDLKVRLKELESKEQKAEVILRSLKEQKERQEELFKQQSSKLERQYYEAIKQAKATLEFKELKDRQRSINKANELKKNIILPQKKEASDFKINDFVKYEKIKGKIKAIKKDEALIECEGLSLRVPLSLLKKSGELPKPTQKANISVERVQNLSPSLDLHGLRSEEAIAKLDKYLSDALIVGFDEVLIYHGIGTGKLAFAVKEFLKTHKSVKEFSDAPLNQGGFGAKVVRF